MSPELLERIYQSVLQAVLWGTDPAEVYLMLEANGIVGEPADAIYRRAFRERLDVIRGEGIRKAVKGALLLAAGGALYWFFWMKMGVITNRLLVLCGLVAGWGAYRLLHGICDILLASRKTGSVVQDD